MVVLVEKYLGERFLLLTLLGFLVIIEINFIFSQYFHQNYLLKMFSKLKNVRKSINSRTDVVEYCIHNLDHQNFFRIVSVKPTLSTLFPLILFWIFLQNTYQFLTYWIIYLFTIVLIYSVHTHAQLELSSANIRIFVLLTGITQIKKCLQHSRYSINICLIALNEST